MPSRTNTSGTFIDALTQVDLKSRMRCPQRSLQTFSIREAVLAGAGRLARPCRQFAAAQPGCTATSGPGPLPLAWDQAPPLALVWSLAVSLLPESTRIMRIVVRGYLTLRDVVGGQPVRFNDSDRLTSRPHKPALTGTRR
jgi:hypothetical protein